MGPYKKMFKDKKTLVIVSCVKRKIWDKYPETGATPAKDTYISPFFKLCKKYAGSFSDRWVILSAKYGLIEPDFLIPENYDVTFKKKSGKYISDSELKKQVKELGLDKFENIIVLGSAIYSKKVQTALDNVKISIKDPLQGLSGKARQRKLESILSTIGNCSSGVTIQCLPVKI